jgi:hypothetical protein
LRRAKISLAREMHQRQGYLDGEDQKTLISFVLYGDPLALPTGLERQSKSVLRTLKPPARVKTVCDRQRDEDASQPVPAEVIAYTKQIVRQYLPGMEEAQIVISQEHSECHIGSHQCPTAQLGIKSKPGHPESASPKRRVIVLSKEVTSAPGPPLCRITLDEQNQMVKLVMSSPPDIPIHYLRDISSESPRVLNHGIIIGCEQKRLVFSSTLVFSLLPDGCTGTDNHPISAVQPGSGQLPSGDEDRRGAGGRHGSPAGRPTPD